MVRAYRKKIRVARKNFFVNFFIVLADLRVHGPQPSEKIRLRGQSRRKHNRVGRKNRVGRGTRITGIFFSPIVSTRKQFNTNT